MNIHPLIDENGRTSRLSMKLELIKAGYLPIIIESEQRFKYYETLDTAAAKENYTPFIRFIAEYEQQELQRYVELIEAHENVE